MKYTEKISTGTNRGMMVMLANKETLDVLNQMLRDYDHGNLNKMLKDYADGNLYSVIRCKDFVG